MLNTEGVFLQQRKWKGLGFRFSIFVQQNRMNTVKRLIPLQITCRLFVIEHDMILNGCLLIIQRQKRTRNGLLPHNFITKTLFNY
jgi:hypothetical protein